MVSILEKKNVDYIVCIGHLGVDRNSSINSDVLCSKVPGIDLFVDGHSHTEMEYGKVCDGSIDLVPSDTLIVSTGCDCKKFGIVTVESDGDMIAKLYRGGIREDATVDALVEKIHRQVDERLKTVR
jgi:5'-nucleotidase